MPDSRWLALIIWSGGTVLPSACTGGSASSCTNTILSEVTSPGAELKAVVFSRDCGATIGFSTQVSVLPAGAQLRPSEGGNLFAVDTAHSAAASGGGGPAVHVEYVPTPSGAPDTVVVRSGDLTLRGLLWTPAGAGPFPAVLFSHGSYGSGDPLGSQDLGALGPVFARHGYVFLFLCRRGIGLSADQGPPDGDLMDSAMTAGGAAGRNRVQLRLLEGEELDEAIAGLAFLRALPQVDERRIAVAGHSFGGSLTLLLAARDTALRAAIVFSAAAYSWSHSSELRRRLLVAARHAPPAFFMHTANDYSTASGKALAAEMGKLGRPHRLRIYPAFGRTAGEGHNFLFRDTAIWEGDVFAFLDSIR